MSTARRSVGEFAVIVMGVLVALGVDDLRQTGEERRIEREAYVQLLEDLRLDSIDLAEARMRAGNRASRACRPWRFYRSRRRHWSSVE